MIRLYDTSRRALVDFTPVREGHVGIYLCGPTVQAQPHIGHLRSALVYDLWRRWFIYRGYDVTFIRNITDIDDKVLDRAGQEPWWALAYRIQLQFADAYDRINIIPPSYEPHTSGTVPQIVELIGRLLRAGNAYVADDESGDVYFDVTSWPTYGELSGQRPESLAPSPDLETRGKRDPRDFALWKGKKPSEPNSASWATPWGRGRPGWHIQCSAMASHYLGDRFDIHGGGLDLRFPHHENELAQSRAAGHPFASYWLHNGLVVIGGQKMSRSLTNSTEAEDLFAVWRPSALRYYLASAHYRSPLDYHEDSLAEADAALERIEAFLRRSSSLADHDDTTDSARLPAAFETVMDNDLNVPQALAVIHDFVRQGNTAMDQDDSTAALSARRYIVAMLEVLGIPTEQSTSRQQPSSEDRERGLRIERMLHDRSIARQIGDFAASDRIRDELSAAGVRVEDSPTGSRWSIT
ncbi:cysteine--tRNA ligase [Agreia sp. Leaf244]|uniref:cysteine--tRNA ligase n=1 Tax=Agreia sp. Leaf244 TaxID=1736305 RepID=UPI0006F35CAF|nr:cysteine--tRNA ligase [Agreia sp. Leaf244]KQO05756.1 cysteine--tRNA ligase [Agreia sp. Leaf244]